MAIRFMTFSNVDRVGREADAAAATLTMDEEAFRAFYDRTARVLWAYLSRTTGDAQAADDLLQECYYRLLRAKVEFENEAHRRHYLFRIAANLARDRRRGTWAARSASCGRATAICCGLLTPRA